MPKVLTTEQIEQFRNEGYAFPFDCLTADEARTCRERIEAYEATIDGDIAQHLRIKVHLGFYFCLKNNTVICSSLCLCGGQCVDFTQCYITHQLWPNVNKEKQYGHAQLRITHQGLMVSC